MKSYRSKHGLEDKSQGTKLREHASYVITHHQLLTAWSSLLKLDLREAVYSFIPVFLRFSVTKAVVKRTCCWIVACLRSESCCRHEFFESRDPERTAERTTVVSVLPQPTAAWLRCNSYSPYRLFLQVALLAVRLTAALCLCPLMLTDV